MSFERVPIPPTVQFLAGFALRDGCFTLCVLGNSRDVVSISATISPGVFLSACLILGRFFLLISPAFLLRAPCGFPAGGFISPARRRNLADLI